MDLASLAPMSMKKVLKMFDMVDGSEIEQPLTFSQVIPVSLALGSSSLMKVAHVVARSMMQSNIHALFFVCCSWRGF